jgi:short-subunit dehydrogenase
MKELTGKVAVITGAGSGIGRALALSLAQQGCPLALADINLSALEETRELTQSKHKISLHELDVSDKAAVFAFAESANSEHGQIDIVINNAGVALAETVENDDYADMEWLFNINFWGVVHGTKAFMPFLKQRPQSHLINISSIFGVIAVPTQSSYNASKFAVRGYTEALRQETAGTSLNVTCVHPGGIKTNIVRNGRLKVSVDGNRDTRSMIEEFDQLARTSSEQAAAAIIKGIKKNKKRVLIGADAKFLDLLQRLLPTLYTSVLSAAFKLKPKVN